ncbi:MAG: hypothetical protein NDJ89_10780 [Oligoflexia bacterium]|nr:hypothetical protein [Oligoflexia bacterium]
MRTLGVLMVMALVSQAAFANDNDRIARLLAERAGVNLEEIQDGLPQSVDFVGKTFWGKECRVSFKFESSFGETRFAVLASDHSGDSAALQSGGLREVSRVDEQPEKLEIDAFRVGPCLGGFPFTSRDEVDISVALESDSDLKLKKVRIANRYRGIPWANERISCGELRAASAER